MNRLDHLTTLAIEEPLEIGKRASKAHRFGWREVQPGQELDNLQRFVGEINDLLAVVEMLHAHGIDMSGVGDRAQITAKKEKVEQFLELSRSVGRLDDRIITRRARP